MSRPSRPETDAERGGPESAGRSLDAAAFAAQPRDASGPVFAEPWQAQAFALAVRLSEQGAFTWPEWAAALAAELKAAELNSAAAGAAPGAAPDDGTRYYEHWVAALEGLVARKGLAPADALARRKGEWARAYRRTPHGKPVLLEAGRERAHE